jgi:hypothetical protein
MISPDLAETVKRLRERHDQAVADIQNNFGAAYSSRIKQDSYSIHQDRAALLDALEGLERERDEYKQSLEKMAEYHDAEQARRCELESSLAEARKGARTDGTHEVCSKCLYGAYYCFSTEMPPVEIWGTCSDEDCPIKRAQHPTAPQETAEKEGK